MASKYVKYFQEVGLQPDDFVVLGCLPSFRARFGVLIHPTVALLRRPFFPRLNVHEVKNTFWMPLERFLDKSLHMSFVIDDKYAVHSFSVSFFRVHRFNFFWFTPTTTEAASIELRGNFV
ncbi:hypothetical protein OSTOST_22704 [Ostertagia ostertagi]